MFKGVNTFAFEIRLLSFTRVLTALFFRILCSFSFPVVGLIKYHLVSFVSGCMLPSAR